MGCVLFEILHLKPPFRAREMDGLYKKVNRGYYGKINRVYSEDFDTILGLLINVNTFNRMACRICFII